VILKSGAVHCYRWNIARKRALIALEVGERLEPAAEAPGLPLQPPMSSSPSTSAMP
jgi:hypothetical protein